MKISRRYHLTYCSNIHPGESWSEVRRNLGTYLPQIRKELAFDGRFGIGLRLSGAAAEALQNPENIAEFKNFLSQGDYYVFTINGFPYGVFHGERVKEQVYLPDWLDEERLLYSNRLAQILAELIPPDLSIPGSVSTVPGAFRDRARGDGAVRAIACRILRHASFLKDLERRTGKTISLAIEAEPRCHIETIEDTVHFFETYLFNEGLLREVSEETGDKLSIEDVRRHVGFCFDACHMAVEFEDPEQALNRLRDAGVEIYKFQISSALRMRLSGGDQNVEQALAPFAEDTYLHQVVEDGPRGLIRYTDLPDAFAAESALPPSDVPREWRVHFHVPIFMDHMNPFETSQDYLVRLIDLIKQKNECPCLEVETYTWDVLPSEYRNVDVSIAIARELRWVRDELER